MAGLRPDAPRASTGPADAGRDLDRVVARLLTVGTYVAVALLAAGALILVGSGRSPLEQSPDFDLGRIPSDLAALRPEGFLWLGLLAVIATPSARVLVSLLGYVRRRERGMAVVALAILAVIALSVALATTSPEG